MPVENQPNLAASPSKKRKKDPLSTCPDDPLVELTSLVRFHHPIPNRLPVPVSKKGMYIGAKAAAVDLRDFHRINELVGWSLQLGSERHCQTYTFHRALISNLAGEPSFGTNLTPNNTFFSNVVSSILIFTLFNSDIPTKGALKEPPHDMTNSMGQSEHNVKLQAVSPNQEHCQFNMLISPSSYSQPGLYMEHITIPPPGDL
ncbi:hypothetical protein DSO57_1030011 [Entomophthora muscae]|uniref:Uncharacterized protein n=1 Tax=Entomophthora muscae TaxID=34485 RepID=A0ACC2TP72_9FUNG|nr:hypothetical protein DSO57_1030011 [Entomophthora muscae]